MIIYFSGTGNSKFVADMLADILNDKAINVLSLIREHKSGDFIDDKLIFVSPCYVSCLLKEFEDLLLRSNYKENAKAWFIFTGAGTKSGSSHYVKKIAKKKHLNYMGIHQIAMPQNYIMFFTTKDEETNKKIISNAIPVIKRIGNKIKNNERLNEQKEHDLEFLIDSPVRAWYRSSFTKTKKFYATDKCIGCGTCVNVCPLNNIKLVDNKPEWGKSCMHCTACINLCPKKAIEYGKRTINKYRYVCKDYKKGDYDL